MNQHKDYLSMDRLALASGTDKSSSFHNYTKIYSKYFAPLRDKAIKFLEIGIHLGHSVKFWESYFPQADLHFIDIDVQQSLYFSRRAKYHSVDQGDTWQLCSFLKMIDGDFDVIIDDGGHNMHQQIESFQTLFYRLKSGGMYFIEDLHTSFWKEHGGMGSKEEPLSGPQTTTEYLKTIVDDLNFIGAKTGCADYQKICPALLTRLNEHQKSIESMHLYNGLCLLLKR